MSDLPFVLNPFFSQLVVQTSRGACLLGAARGKLKSALLRLASGTKFGSPEVWYLEQWLKGLTQ